MAEPFQFGGTVISPCYLAQPNFPIPPFPEIPQITIRTKQNAYVQSESASYSIGRRAFLVASTGIAITLTSCSKLNPRSTSADDKALQQVLADKQEILSELEALALQRSDLAPTVTQVAEQTKIHIGALLEFLSSNTEPSMKPIPVSGIPLSQLLNNKAADHAAKAIDLKNADASRILIQICASESVQATQLLGLGA